ncbi:MAG: phosphatase PAP2 family protein [Candidatus Gracilibacteria bacterium]|nr:phosphatase PAP2 family protein [Candidatus Gracilibacteria bacterium]
MNKKKALLTLNILSIMGFALVAILTKLNILKSLDLLISQKIAEVHTPDLDKYMTIITNIGDKYILTAFFAFLITFLLFQKNKPNVYIALLSASLGFGLVNIIKITIGRIRPENGKIFETGLSFPSAHATMSTVFALLSAYFFSIRFPKQKNKIIVLSIVFFVLISTSRVILNVHYLSDILAGIFLGIFCFSVSILIFSKLFPENK